MCGFFLWVFYLVSLVYISVFVSVPHSLDDYSFVVWSEVRKVDSSSFILIEVVSGQGPGNAGPEGLKSNGRRRIWRMHQRRKLYKSGQATLQ